MRILITVLLLFQVVQEVSAQLRPEVMQLADQLNTLNLKQERREGYQYVLMDSIAVNLSKLATDDELKILTDDTSAYVRANALFALLGRGGAADLELEKLVPPRFNDTSVVDIKIVESQSVRMKSTVGELYLTYVADYSNNLALLIRRL